MTTIWLLVIVFFAGALISLIIFSLWLKRWRSVHEQKIRQRIAIAKREAHLDSRESQVEYAHKFEKKTADIDSRQRQKTLWLEQQDWQIKERMKALNSEVAALEERIRGVERLENDVRTKQAEVDDLQLVYRKRLLELTNLSVEAARACFLESIEKEYALEFELRKRELYQQGSRDIEAEACRVIVGAMQRMSTNPTSNASAVIVRLPNEEIKGRLIGKEGRNIKTFETVTGTNLVIDESPGIAIISSFDPVRREIARSTLEALVADGRVHPVIIEELVHKAQNQMDSSLLELGRDVLFRLGIHGVGLEVISLLGKLNYRLSNNQNTLEHSEEVAYLCSMMASELGLDPEVAKRCGLYHDLGKAVSHDFEGSHASVAAKILKRNGEDDPRVINAVASSHDEVPAESIYAELLKIADSLSATRPGARSDSMDGYIHRIRSLEAIADSFEGVDEVYALQAGREIRVIVHPDFHQDEDAFLLAGRIRNKIEEQMSFPGKIKVTVIREQRFSEIAK